LPLDPDFYRGRIDAATLIDIGYADAKQYLKQMPADGLPFDPNATKMRDAGVGISFRQSMAGRVALGETDPARGAATGGECSFHLAANIHDLQNFLRDPEPAAVVHGHLSFAPYGENISATTGILRLISSGDSSKAKLIVCELGFEPGGAGFHLAGKGEIKGEVDLMKDAFELEVQLYQGAGKNASVTAAGILRMGLSDFIRMVSSIHVTNAGSAEEEARALFEFGRFFFGAVWDVYHQQAAAEQT
jgi:hypothetical protein